MQYTINYDNQGKILGFVKSDTNLNIEVSNSVWVEAQGYNKIIIKGESISFEKVDWRTEEEIDIESKFKFRVDRDALLLKADIAISKAEDMDKDTKALRAYRQALRDATIKWVIPESII